MVRTDLIREDPMQSQMLVAGSKSQLRTYASDMKSGLMFEMMRIGIASPTQRLSWLPFLTRIYIYIYDV